MAANRRVGIVPVGEDEVEERENRAFLLWRKEERERLKQNEKKWVYNPYILDPTG